MAVGAETNTKEETATKLDNGEAKPKEAGTHGGTNAIANMWTSYSWT